MGFRACGGYSVLMADTSTPPTKAVSAAEALRRLRLEAPELVRAADEVDQTLLDRAAELSPLERVEVASKHLADLRRFRPR